MRRLLLPALLALALAACGGGDGDTPAEAGGTGMAAPTGGTTTAEDPDTATSSDGSTTMTSPPPSPPAAGGGSSGSTGRQPAPLPGLPAWTAGYRDWTKLNAAPLPARSPDPHLGTKNVFASRPTRGGTYPPGTIVVKEAFRPGKDFVGLIAAMRKIEGRNPEHNDWVFIEWTRESADAPFTELASGAVCESCHQGVADQDYVFTTG